MRQFHLFQQCPRLRFIYVRALHLFLRLKQLHFQSLNLPISVSYLFLAVFEVDVKQFKVFFHFFDFGLADVAV
jgi:hypothetical protein